MKKILLTMVILVFGTFSLFAQEAEATKDTPSQATTTSATSEADGGSASNDSITKLDYVVPRFPAINSINDGMLQLDLDRLTNYVAVIRDDYLFRVVYKIDKIVERYTNDNYIDTNNMDYVDLDIYNIVSSEMASDGNVALGIVKANEGLSYLKTVKPSLVAIGKTNDVQQIDYHLNLYAGILNMYTGSGFAMKQSLNHFNYILDSGIVDDDVEMYVRLNTYIASINSELLKIEFNNDLLRRSYYNNMFDALWNIVDKSTTDENMKDAKFTVLINQFYSVIYVTTDQFKNVYSKYFDKLGYSYGQTEEAIADKPVREEFKNDAPQDSTAADTTAATDTTTTTE